MTASKEHRRCRQGFSRPARKDPVEGAGEDAALQMGELSELLGYVLKRAQLKIFEDFLRCVAPLQLTPAQSPCCCCSTGIPAVTRRDRQHAWHPEAEFRGHAGRAGEPRSAGADAFGERSPLPHPGADDKGRAVLARAKKLVATKHEARLNEVLGPANRAALLEMMAKLAREF